MCSSQCEHFGGAHLCACLSFGYVLQHDLQYLILSQGHIEFCLFNLMLVSAIFRLTNVFTVRAFNAFARLTTTHCKAGVATMLAVVI